MVDIFALVLAHGLLALAAWRLLLRPELDEEGGDQQAGDAEGRAGNARRHSSRGASRKGMQWPRSDGAAAQEGGTCPAAGDGHA
ncbi:hypothetical protein [Novosphingobium sp. KA1]|uniref:hypothetical protein n=1 Tax=Novosphingobium sp. (strain KA1) TaxID=164608 RepID=UPI001A8D2F73|nr:hypothetical protein [Novosphingobium sp. KA1]QSR17010.1 hypothetical protein CA833_07390 [Novosphingobium sp. KA1]